MTTTAEKNWVLYRGRINENGHLLEKAVLSTHSSYDEAVKALQRAHRSTPVDQVIWIEVSK